MKLTGILFLAVVIIVSLTSQSALGESNHSSSAGGQSAFSESNSPSPAGGQSAFSESNPSSPASSQASGVDRPSPLRDRQSGVDRGSVIESMASAEQLKAIADAAQSASAMVHLAYDRFDVYIPEDYYNANTPSIDNFFDLFEPRFDYLEEITGWSSEKFYGNKLQITVYAMSTGCHSALGTDGVVDVFFPDPFDKAECFPSGGFGQDVTLLVTVIRQAARAILPVELYYRPWLEFGFPAYWAYNALVPFGDVTQHQADSAIFAGESDLNWTEYTANDYHDILGNDIQESMGADITAWIFTLAQAKYGTDWPVFFHLFNENPETLAKADSLWESSPYYPDMFVVNLFARTMQTTFDIMKQQWRYTGPYGPGYGLRQWVDIDWYADLNCDFTIDFLRVGEPTLIPAVVRNTGQVNLKNVDVVFTVGDSIIWRRKIDVPAGGSVDVSTSVTLSVEGDYLITLEVDEVNQKLETNENNNSKVQTVPCLKCCGYYTGGYTGNTDCSVDGKMNLGDVTRLIDRVYLTKNPLCCEENGNVDGDNEGKMGLSDITVLIDHIYLSRQATAACE